MSPSYSSNQERCSHPWLQDQVYEPRRQRTIVLVRQAIDGLNEIRKHDPKQRISVTTVLAQTRVIDSTGVGVSETGLRGNQEAWDYFCRYRTWRHPTRTKGSKQPGTLRIKHNRDLETTRRQYMRYPKSDLVQRLIHVEQAYADREARWLEHQDEILEWRQRALLAEQRIILLERQIAEGTHTSNV